MMKISYLILAHKNLDHIDRLIKKLKHKHSLFFLHIDKKIPYDEIKRYDFIKNKDVFILRKRFAINWGGFNMVEATLSLLRKAIEKNHKGYYILMSGDDYPIKSTDFIYNFLFQNYGREYLDHFTLPSDRWAMSGGLDRIGFYWFIDKLGLEKSFNLYELQKKGNLRRPYFKNFTPYGGSQWWCITDKCVNYILAFLNFNRNYKEFFELTYIADEMFFHNLILNSDFFAMVCNDTLKYIDWNSGPQYPKLLDLSDLTIVTQSSKLFARKFIQGSELLDYFDKL